MSQMDIDNLYQPTEAAKPSYHRTTSRIGDLAVTFMEDGGIGLKRGKEVLTTTADEMQHIIHLGTALRDHTKELAKFQALGLDISIEGVQLRLDELKAQRAKISNEHGV